MKITAISDVTETIAPMPESARPYVLESREFERHILAKRTVVTRSIADLDREIERLQVEVTARTVRRDDLLSIVRRIDTMLAVTIEGVNTDADPPSDDPATGE